MDLGNTQQNSQVKEEFLEVKSFNQDFTTSAFIFATGSSMLQEVEAVESISILDYMDLGNIQQNSEVKEELLEVKSFNQDFTTSAFTFATGSSLLQEVQAVESTDDKKYSSIPVFTGLGDIQQNSEVNEELEKVKSVNQDFDANETNAETANAEATHEPEGSTNSERSFKFKSKEKKDIDSEEEHQDTESDSDAPRVIRVKTIRKKDSAPKIPTLTVRYGSYTDEPSLKCEDTSENIQSLHGEEYLDEVIMRYYIHNEIVVHSLVYIFDAQFFGTLEHAHRRKKSKFYSECSKLTESFNWNLYRFIMFPVCLDQHWVFVVVQNPQKLVGKLTPTIAIIDSKEQQFFTDQRETIFTIVKQYLQHVQPEQAKNKFCSATLLHHTKTNKRLRLWSLRVTIHANRQLSYFEFQWSISSW